MIGTRVALVVGAAVLGACAYKGPAVAGYAGLGYEIETYYRHNAWEENATCLSPEMSISDVQVLEDTPEKVVLQVRYYYRDRTFETDDEDSFGFIQPFACEGFSERVFTATKRPDGTLDVVTMTGPQRG